MKISNISAKEFKIITLNNLLELRKECRISVRSPKEKIFLKTGGEELNT